MNGPFAIANVKLAEGLIEAGEDGRQGSREGWDCQAFIPSFEAHPRTGCESGIKSIRPGRWHGGFLIGTGWDGISMGPFQVSLSKGF